MNKKFLIKYSNEQKNRVDKYLKDLFETKSDPYIKLLALDYLAGLIDTEPDLRDKLEHLYQEEKDLSVKNVYKKVLSNTYKSIYQKHKERRNWLKQELEEQGDQSSTSSNHNANFKDMVSILKYKSQSSQI